MTSMVVDGIPVQIDIRDLPLGMSEEVFRCSDDSYTILLNARYDSKTQRESCLHAIEHIKRGDWEKADVGSIEAEAHGLKNDEAVKVAARTVKNERSKYRRKLRKYEMMWKDMSGSEREVYQEWIMNEHERWKEDPEYKRRKNPFLNKKNREIMREFEKL